MLAVVTGATGHLGANLVRALLDTGRPVRCLVRSDVRALEGLDVERVRGDVDDPDSLRRAFTGARTVFHLAGRISLAGGDGGLVAATNVDGVRHVTAAALHAGAGRFVHVSSIHARRDPGAGGAVDESTPPADGADLPEYDRSKAAGERVVLEAVAAGLDAVILEPTAVIGPFDFKPSAMGRVIVRLTEGRMPVMVAGGFDWVDGRDVAAAAIAAEHRGRTGERYIVGGTRAEAAEIGRLVAAAAGVAPPRLTIPLPLALGVAPLAEAAYAILRRPPVFTRESLRALATHRRIDRSKAERELGHRPRPLEETIADAVAWFRARRGSR